MPMETGEFTNEDADILAEWEAKQLPKAFRCFRKMIMGEKRRKKETEEKSFYEVKLEEYLEKYSGNIEIALFRFYKEVLLNAERNSFFEMFKAIISAAQKGEKVKNLATKCGANLDIAEFFRIKLKKAEADDLQVSVDALRCEAREAMRETLARLKKQL